ncbi:hypothetical protein OEZ85_010874 [Tetradesmus obliquus]|uniref:J domain-containing protein n=1 Tax=Tetradesmus obliquus TaxID=3088 RepID=A0ABY8TNJ6_TETOB|nr:hypothetical protein OEZ85_010874 [Tetradesmus obliquus]
MHTIQQQLAPHTARTRIPAQQHCRFSRTPRFRLKSVNYYDVLEVDAEADLQEIKTAFRQKAKQLHPDVNQAPDADQVFRQLRKAHDVLSDKMLRMEHDSQLGLPSARAADPRFARFERWRREVVPDLRMAMDVWGAEVFGIITAADQALWVQEQQLLQLQQQPARSSSSSSSNGSSSDGVLCVSDASRDRQEAAETAAALVASMQGILQDAIANVQRLYDKRYQQVEVRYPAYPSLVWYDVWEDMSGEWLAASSKLQQNWKRRMKAAGEVAAAVQATAAAADVGG